MQICCSRLTISTSFALSSFFFSRRLGVAPAAFAKLATATLRCCGTVGGCGAGRSETVPFEATVACGLSARSAVEELGDSRVFARTSVSLRDGLGTDR
jgi:hypothetical protein